MIRKWSGKESFSNSLSGWIWWGFGMEVIREGDQKIYFSYFPSFSSCTFYFRLLLLLRYSERYGDMTSLLYDIENLQLIE